MKRVIKFRGLRTDGQGWVYGDLWRKPLFHGSKCLIYVKDGDEEIDDTGWTEVTHASVGQFTGLLDKNGKEVYDGDRLRHLRKFNTGHISLGKVVFRNGGFYLDYGNLIYEPSILINRTDYTFEVIGNIHEESEVSNG